MIEFPQLVNSYFAIAGLICAAGPLLIHLLNRRRYRLVHWAAMEFLLEAVQQRQRRLRLRDLLLLLLRTAAVLLFGLALAQPYWASGGAPLARHAPRHLVLLVDNSLSMGYRALEATRLERVKRQAGELIESLPDGSQITVLATCGAARYRQGPFRVQEEALEFLATIPLVDQPGQIAQAITTAREAIGSAAPMADQVVYFTDLQRGNWPADLSAKLVAGFPLLHIRDMSNARWQNTWVAAIRVRDDVVDLDTPAKVFVTLGHHGASEHRCQIFLAVGGRTVATRSIVFPPGDLERQVTMECSFADAAVEPGRATFVPLEVSLSPDRLPEDDRRTLMVPVVSSLPVLFVDQFDDQQEDPVWGRLGETRPLRHLLAPQTAARGHRPLIETNHVTIDRLNRALLATARLVVMAGVAGPGDQAELLYDYVRHGGKLVVAAGGEFDPVAWHAAAGPDGVGLLNGKLAAQPLGELPTTATGAPLEPFALDDESMTASPLTRLPGLSDGQLRSIYREPLFFRAVAFEPAAEHASPATRPTGPSGSESQSWLAWQPPAPWHATAWNEGRPTRHPSAALSVIARFEDPPGVPFLVRHRIGAGDVLFCSSSILPTWNNVAQTNAIILWDHVLRSLLRDTLPRRNFSPQDSLAIRVPASRRRGTIGLERPQPQSSPEWLEVGFITEHQQGTTIHDVWTRGRYRLKSARPTGEVPALDTPWQLELAVNGDARESDLSPLSRGEIQARIIETGIGQLRDDQALAQPERTARGSTLWWWLILLVLLLLMAELMLLLLSNRPLRDVARA